MLISTYFLFLQITKDFCQWVENIGGTEESQITEERMHQLFEIAPAARPLCVRFEELPVATENAARAHNLPEVSIATREGCSAGDLNVFHIWVNLHQLAGRKVTNEENLLKSHGNLLKKCCKTVFTVADWLTWAYCSVIFLKKIIC
jgi:hypothetical protein